MAVPSGVRQVALSSGRDLDRTLAFWHDCLLLPLHSRFDPPGIAFIMIGSVRLFFAGGTPPATVYLDEPELLTFADAAVGADVPLMSPPAVMHVDSAGQFGPAGEAEWMAFLKDPAGNTIGLVARKPA